MSEDIVISVKNITKTYRLYNSHADRVKESFHPFRKKYHHPFNALTDISLRQNIYMNCAILGLTREEIDARFDDIVAFADIGDFIGQPVKSYSSGMYVRLAFAVAINIDPDILIVDEALSVGDEGFQRKCFSRIRQIQERGGTILFVSHGAGTIIELCTRAMLFDQGELILNGSPKKVVSYYHMCCKVRKCLAWAWKRKKPKSQRLLLSPACIGRAPLVDSLM
jgi:ABC-type polysaccharide/polyol phosphate transport system ATPase subunit